MRQPTIRVTIVYLGGSRGEAGCDREDVDLPRESTVASAAQWVAEHHPALAAKLATVRWARNYEFASLDESLADGDELGLLPPVCGGAPRAVLTREPIDAHRLVQQAHDPEVGATVLFVGSVRRHSHGAEVQRIDYEAYQPMAERQLERIAEAAEKDHGARAVRLVHRHGSIAVGEVSVAIVAAAEHRSEAFAACRAVIEAIKHDVPIWKREITILGEEWEGWGGG